MSNNGGSAMPAPPAHSVQSKNVWKSREKIRFITRKWPPAVGGMETYSVKLSEALRNSMEVDVWALPGKEDGSPPSSLALLGFGLRSTVRLVLTRNAGGIVHVADMASWPLAFMARLRSRKWATFLSAHGTDVSYPLRGGIRGKLYGAYLRLGATLLPGTVVIANSDATAACTRTYGFRAVETVPLATDMRPVDPRPAVEPFILFAGRLVERKGCGWFIRNVLQQLPGNLVLKVAGKVWSPKEAEALKSEQVEFLGPVVPEHLRLLYAQAICVVVPNIDMPNGEFEGFGLVATEAAAAGGVVLAARHSGLKEAVIDRKTGFLLDPGIPDGWIAKITEVASWPREERLAFAGYASTVVRDHYSWDRVARDMMCLYSRGPRSR